MAADSLAPHDYSPSRETPWMAVGLLVAAAIFGLWRGVAGRLAAEHVGSPTAPATDAASPRAARALPEIGASTDTLIPPEAQDVAAAPRAAAPAPVRVQAAAPAVEPSLEPRARPAAVKPEDPGLAPAPLPAVEEEPPPQDEEDPPPDDGAPY